MIQISEELVFDIAKDLHEVDQYGYIDLVDCLSNGEVPTQVSESDVAYNDIEDPSSILGKPNDVFELYRMNDYVKSVGQSSSTDDAPVEQE